MLKSLYILNYALINEVHINFCNGFSVITGETGAGKSIILGALSLILGQRADSKSIKTDSDKCIIEAEFDISAYRNLELIFSENDLDYSNSCVIRREITNSGKSRAFINDTPVSLNTLRELTSLLIDIHSQHDNLLIQHEGYQLDVLDTVAKNKNFLNNYIHKYSEWQSLNVELEKLEKVAKQHSNDVDYIQFQYKQLAEATIIDTEQEELEQEQSILSHAEEIKLELVKCIQIIDENDRSLLPSIKEVNSSLFKIKQLLPIGESWLERLQSIYIELKDIETEIRSQEEKIEYNPQRLDWVNSRLSELYSLQKKYKVDSNTALIEIRENLKEQLTRIENYDEDIALLQKKINNVFEELKLEGLELTKSRKRAIESTENFLVEQLNQLGMPNIQFKIQLTTLKEYSKSGIDEVQFLFSANKNRELQPVQQIASGGEIARLMLSIKYLISNKSDLPTIIFDEIDTGVSGEIANRMGEIMKNMGTELQVITITHLPQIAAKSNQHYRVYKDDSGVQTQTHIQKLDNEERIQELAQMLSGKNLTEASILNAKELIGMN